MKRKEADDEVNGDFFDFTLSSPALKIRRLDTEFAPVVGEHETMDSMEFGQSMPLQNNFVEQTMETSPVAIDELNSSMPVNEERAIVLFNPMNNTRSLQSPIPFSISTDSDFLSRFRNPVIWSNGSGAAKPLADETHKEDDDSGMVNGSLAVVPWVPNHSQISDMMDSDAMDVEGNCGDQQTPKHPVTTQDWSQWQQHCMIQQPPTNFSTPVTWLGSPKKVTSNIYCGKPSEESRHLFTLTKKSRKHKRKSPKDSSSAPAQEMPETSPGAGTSSTFSPILWL